MILLEGDGGGRWIWNESAEVKKQGGWVMPGRRGLVCVALIGCLVVGGCVGKTGSSNAPADTWAGVRAEGREYVGTVLSGPRAEKVAGGEAVRVEVTWVGVDRVPVGAAGLGAVDERSKLTYSPSSEAVVASGVLTRGVNFGEGDAARKFREELFGGRIGAARVVGWKSGMVLAGTTVEFALMEEGKVAVRGRGVGVSVARGGSGGAATRPTTQDSTTRSGDVTAGGGAVRDGTVSIGVSDFVKGSASGTGMLGRETAVIGDVEVDDGAVMAVVVPMSLAGTGWKAVVALVEVHAAGVADAGAVAELKENLNKSALVAQARTRPAGSGLDLPSAVAALYGAGGYRQPLLFLAGQTGAGVASDFVLVADDAMLGKLAGKVKEYAAKEGQSKWVSGMGWEMDRGALGLMAEALEGQNPPGGVVAVLGVWGGEAGRQADLVREMLRTSGNREALEQRLVAENLIMLEDNSPGARVRAYDWLNSKGKAPAGFNPLGSAKSRRAALDQALGGAGGEQ